MSIFKYLAEKNLAKREKELERLVNFFDETLGKREDYDILRSIIMANIELNDYDVFKKIQEEKIERAKERDSGTSRIKENIKRMDYLQNLENSLVESKINFQEKQITNLYQLIKIAEKEKERIKKKKEKKCFLRKIFKRT